MHRLRFLWNRCRTFFENNFRAHPVLCYGALLTAMAVASHLQWFNPLSILEYGDWQYRPDESVRQQVSSWMTWVPFNNLGAANVLMSGFPLRGLAWGVITQLGLSYDIATKLTLFLPVALGGFLVPFWVGRRLFKDDFVAFMAATFYGSTAYFLTLQTGHLPIAAIYALLPLIVWRLDVALRRNVLRDWLIVALLFCIGVFYEVRIMYIVTAVLILYAVVFVCLNRPRISPYLKHLSIAGVLIVLCNIFWLVPTKLAAAQGIDEIAGRGLFGSHLFSVLQSIAVMKWNWTGGVIDRTFTAQPVPLYLLIVPVVIAVGLLVAQKYRRQMVFFLCLTLIGIILTKQSAPPFSGLYEWLYYNFPGFVLFREASKFYVLVAFGYFGLLGYGLLALKQYGASTKARHIGFGVAAIWVLMAAGCALWPAITMQLGNTFKNAQMPADYGKLKQFIANQPEFFRTYWLPRESWWGYYDNNHPKVRAVDMAVQDWRNLPLERGSGAGYDLARSAVGIFEQPYAPTLFRNASIKYVIVPLRDTANDDDFFGSYGDDRSFYIAALDQTSFLRRVDIGTKEVAVYENQDYRPYITASSGVYQGNERLLTKLAHTDIDASYDIASEIIRPDDGKRIVGSAFGAEDQYALDGRRVTQQLRLDDPARLVMRGTQWPLSYLADNNHLQLSALATGAMLLNSQPVTSGTEAQSLGGTNLEKSREYYLSVGDEISPVLRRKQPQPLGWLAESVRVWQADERNLIPNGSLDAGLWQPAVKDCNAYDNRAAIGMLLSPQGSAKQNNALQLRAFNHTACTGQQGIAVNADQSYLFGFDYRLSSGQKAGFKLVFNDPKQTTIRQDITSRDRQWHTFRQKVTAPDGATAVSYELYGFPDEHRQQYAITHYDAIQLVALSPVLTVHPPAGLHQSVPLPAGNNRLEYIGTEAFANLIPNGSFEQGAWTKKVGDCNAYDNKPDIAMDLDRTTAIDGKRSLMLSARRHTACTTSPQIDITPHSTYRLQFAYRGAPGTQATYTLRFNDPLGTVHRERINIKSSGWHNHQINVASPTGATKLSLTLYAEPEAVAAKTVRIHYDKVRLTDVSPLAEPMLTLRDPKREIVAPRKISFDGHAPTRKTIRVEGATTPFYLIMNEAYHDGWRLLVDNNRSSGWLGSWLPMLRPYSASSDHFKVNLAMNGWYVDAAKLCQQPSACHKNADGSYTIALVAEFAPQRLFYAGLVVSGLAFVVAIGYVVAPAVRRLWSRKRKISR